MKKSLGAIRIKIQVKEARLKNHCKLSRNERVAFVYEIKFEKKPKRFRWRKIFSNFFRTMKLIAKLAKKVINVKMFGL